MSEAAIRQMSGVSVSTMPVAKMFRSRGLLIHVAIFLASYVVFLAFTKPTPAGIKALPGPTPSLLRKVQAVEVALLPTSWTQPASQSQSTSQASMTSAIPVSTNSARSEVAAEQPATFVPDYSSVQRHIESLEQAARFDENPANRLAGISGLQQLAATGDPDGSILEDLRMASQDGDPTVAAAAQRAYDQLKAARQNRQ